MEILTQITELDNLIEYLRDRFEGMGIPADPGSSADAQILSPLRSRLMPDPYDTPVREFILSRLESELDIVVQQGEVMDTTIVNAMKVIIEPLRRQVRQVATNQSVSEPSLLSTTEADNRGANFFTKRRKGKYSVGVVRTFYSSPQYSSVDRSVEFSTAAGLKFHPVESQSITADRMVFNSVSNLFFFDVVVGSIDPGSQYNIGDGELVFVDGLPSVVKVTNPSSFSGGVKEETAEEFLKRVDTSLTEKSLVTDRGIRARMFDVFDDIKLVQSIGMGDPEMERDILTTTGSSGGFRGMISGITTIGGSGDIVMSTPGSFALISESSYSIFSSFIDAGISAGDTLSLFVAAAAPYENHQVLKVSEDRIYLTVPADDEVDVPMAAWASSIDSITISGVPGGVLVPDTPYGGVTVDSGELHIGGKTDVFVRPEGNQSDSFILEGVRDEQPAVFGVDLESFGEAPDSYVILTPVVAGAYMVPANDRFGTALVTTDELLLRFYSSSGVDTPLRVTEYDIGKYLQITRAAPNESESGTYKLLEILNTEHVERTSDYSVYAMRVKVELIDLETGAVPAGLATTTDFLGTETIRVVDSISHSPLVRDRKGLVEDSSSSDTIYAGVNLLEEGAEIGDSLIIETGDDAGIYTIRAFATSLILNDTVVLDRALSKSKSISDYGSGANIILTTKGTALRFRVDDELDLNLVNPVTPKIPIGSFEGSDLSTSAQSNILNTLNTDLLIAGVEVGDTVEILSGENKGKYSVLEVTSDIMKVSSRVKISATAQQYKVYTAQEGITLPLVRLTSIDLLDSSLQDTGVQVPYGGVVDARVLGPMSDKGAGTLVESYTGVVTDNGGVFDLVDANVDFVSEGILPGHRLNLFDGIDSGSYTVELLGPDFVESVPPAGSEEHYLRVVPDSNNRRFTSEAAALHYSAGVSSSGICRLYFKDPTSFSAIAGNNGATLRVDNSTGLEYRLVSSSEHRILPDEGNSSDMEVMSSLPVIGGYDTSLSLREVGALGVFGKEIKIGDVVETYDELHLLRSSFSPDDTVWDGDTSVEVIAGLNYFFPGGYLRYEDGETWFKILSYSGTTVVIEDPGTPIPAGTAAYSNVYQDYRGAGLLGSPAGLTTTAGSNLLQLPEGSSASFERTNDVTPLAGQTIELLSGPDAGVYEITDMVDYKTLRISKVLTSTTATVFASGDNGVISDAGSPSKFIFTDGDTSPSAGGAVGDFITIFEAARSDVGGSYEIASILSVTELELSGEIENPDGVVESRTAADSIGWVRSSVEDPLVHFKIYAAVPKRFEVTSVAPTSGPVFPASDEDPAHMGEVTDANTMTDPAVDFSAVSRGDLLEILEGPNRGSYFVDSGANGSLTTSAAMPFPEFTRVGYRVRGGIHGAENMLRVSAMESFDGLVEVGENVPYRIVRPDIVRISSTDMEESTEGGLYYLDVDIESVGSGPSQSLQDGDRLILNTDNVLVEGYTYFVGNRSLTFSPYEDVSVKLSNRFLPVGNSDFAENLEELVGRSLKFSFEHSPTVLRANDLLRSSADRPLNSDPIARHFLPSYILAVIEYRGGPTVADLTDDVEDLLNSFGATEELKVSDIEGLLMAKGVTYVKHPVNLVSLTHDLSRNIVANRSVDGLGGLNTVPYDGTGRISAMFAVVGGGVTLVRLS